jgi:arylsulfatase A-like enzyme
LVRNLDLAPTLVELAGSQIPESFQGASLARILRGVAPSPIPRLTSFARVGSQRSLTSQRWHLMWDRATGQVTLYDLASDPAGFRNAASEYPGAVRHIKARLARLEQSRKAADRRAELLRAAEAGQNTNVENGEILRQLEALGYAEPES